MTKFKQDIAILSILKKVLVLADVVVFERSVNLDFGLKLMDKRKRNETTRGLVGSEFVKATDGTNSYLLASPGLDKVRLGNNLDCIRLVRIQGGTKVHFSKTSFPQESTTKIPVQGKSFLIRPTTLFFNDQRFIVGRGRERRGQRVHAGWGGRRRRTVVDGRHEGRHRRRTLRGRRRPRCRRPSHITSCSSGRSVPHLGDTVLATHRIRGRRQQSSVIFVSRGLQLGKANLLRIITFSR